MTGPIDAPGSLRGAACDTALLRAAVPLPPEGMVLGAAALGDGGPDAAGTFTGVPPERQIRSCLEGSVAFIRS